MRGPAPAPRPAVRWPRLRPALRWSPSRLWRRRDHRPRRPAGLLRAFAGGDEADDGSGGQAPPAGVGGRGRWPTPPPGAMTHPIASPRACLVASIPSRVASSGPADAQAQNPRCTAFRRNLPHLLHFPSRYRFPDVVLPQSEKRIMPFTRFVGGGHPLAGTACAVARSRVRSPLTWGGGYGARSQAALAAAEKSSRAPRVTAHHAVRGSPSPASHRRRRINQQVCMLPDQHQTAKARHARKCPLAPAR